MAGHAARLVAGLQPRCSHEERSSSHEQRLHPVSSGRRAACRLPGRGGKGRAREARPPSSPCVERPEDGALSRATRSPAAALSATRRTSAACKARPRRSDTPAGRPGSPSGPRRNRARCRSRTKPTGPGRGQARPPACRRRGSEPEAKDGWLRRFWSASARPRRVASRSRKLDGSTKSAPQSRRAMSHGSPSLIVRSTMTGNGTSALARVSRSTPASA